MTPKPQSLDDDPPHTPKLPLLHAAPPRYQTPPHLPYAIPPGDPAPPYTFTPFPMNSSMRLVIQPPPKNLSDAVPMNSSMRLVIQPPPHTFLMPFPVNSLTRLVIQSVLDEPSPNTWGRFRANTLKMGGGGQQFWWQGSVVLTDRYTGSLLLVRCAW